MLKLNCKECNNSFEKEYSVFYCSAECRSKNSARVMAETNRKHASARMSKNNPMSRPECKQKMIDTLKRIGHKPVVRGGNGTGLSPAEKALSDATGLLPYTVSTNIAGISRHQGYPTHYKIDLADPARKLAIEIDGASHNAISRQEQDRKKELFLNRIGWTVLRFTNKQALEETEKCCDLISRTV